ncbi:MAG: isocitrate/isopropylmalate family dehydrogenase, partial [Pseudomonadota bacterium]
MAERLRVALIKGDGIGIDVAEAAVAVVDAALARLGLASPVYEEIACGAGHYRETGQDIEPGGEARAGAADAIFLGAIGLPSVRYPDGTEISPHLRLRDRFGLYAGVRPVRAYP